MTTERCGGILSISQVMDMLVINTAAVIVGIALQYSTIITKRKRGLVGGLLGAAVVISYCGWPGVFTLSPILVFMMWKILPRRIQSKTSIIAFGLIILSRLLFRQSLSVFGLQTSDLSVANTIHMFVSLRCVSLMYEICESRQKTSKTSTIAPEYITKEPSMLQSICYFVYLPGICIGPFYTYQTYKDNTEMSVKTLQSIPKKQVMMNKMIQTVVMMGIILTLSYTVGNVLIDDTQKYADLSLGLQYFYLLVANIVTSCTLYAMWRGGEITCVAFSLGAYCRQTKIGQGPVQNKDVTKNTRKWNFTTIFNGDGQLWFLEPNIPNLLRNWNATVHWWLLRYVYTNQYTPRSMKLVRFVFTQIVNAAWHGSTVGYFACLCGFVVGSSIEALFELEAKKCKQWRGVANVLQRFVFPVTFISVCNVPFMTQDIDKLITFGKVAYQPVIAMVVMSFGLLKVFEIIHVTRKTVKIK